jgi:hypothetical protein
MTQSADWFIRYETMLLKLLVRSAATESCTIAMHDNHTLVTSEPGCYDTPSGRAADREGGTQLTSSRGNPAHSAFTVEPQGTSK